MVLRCFGASDRELGNGEIVERTKLPAATVSRLAFTLVVLGYLVHRPDSGRYALGAGVLTLGFGLLSRLEIRTLARPIMRAMADETATTVSLATRHGLSVVYVEVCRSSAPLIFAVEVGGRVPLATTAHGRAWLSSVDETTREHVLGDVRDADPVAWQRQHAGLARAAADWRRYGFVTTEGDWEPDIHAVGTALVLDDPSEHFTLSCGGPASKMPRRALIERYGPALLQAARRIESACARAQA